MLMFTALRRLSRRHHEGLRAGHIAFVNRQAHESGCSRCADAAAAQTLRLSQSNATQLDHGKLSRACS